PAASTATPDGALKPEARVRMVPSGRTSLTALFFRSATKTSPAPSTATPCGPLKPEPMVRARGGGEVGAVEDWDRAVAVEPPGLTVPCSVAVLRLVTAAAPVTAVAGARRSSSASSWGWQRAAALRDPSGARRGVRANRLRAQNRMVMGKLLY